MRRALGRSSRKIRQGRSASIRRRTLRTSRYVEGRSARAEALVKSDDTSKDVSARADAQVGRYVRGRFRTRGVAQVGTSKDVSAGAESPKVGRYVRRSARAVALNPEDTSDVSARAH